MTTSVTRYSAVAIGLHWAIALFIVFNLLTGFFLHDFPRVTIVLHISSGITVLALTAFRVFWRFTHPRPAYPANYARWEVKAANAVHFLLYVLMISLPLSGWALISANPPTGSVPALQAAAAQVARGEEPRRTGGPPIWFLFKLPLIKPINEMGRQPEDVPAQQKLHDQFDTLHWLGGWTMLTLFLLHVAGALKHQFVDRHRELARMGIGKADAA
jgi:cytochrome b561